MAEDFYAALMMRKALPESVDITTITAPGIYPVDVGNISAPSSHGGVLVVLPPQTNPSLTFVDANDHAPWSFVDGEWSSVVRTVNNKLPANGNVQLGSGDILSQYSHMNTTGGYDLNYLTSAGIQSVISDEVAASELNTGFPVPLAGLLVVLEGVAGVTQFYYVRQSSAIYTRSGKADAFSADDWTPWAIHYTSENKPTASDTGALPLYPLPLTIDLNTLGATESAGVYCQQMDANALPELNYPIAQSGTLVVTPSAYGCQQEYTTFNTGQKFVRGLTTSFDGVSGQWGPWRQYFGDSNAPPYPVTSVNGMTGAVVIPAPDLSGYETIADANARFVTATRFGANMSDHWGGNGGTVPPGCALTGGDFNSDNEYPIYAYMQYLINGVWINASGGVGAASRVSGSHYRAVPENGISSLINLRPYLRESNDPVDLPGVPHFIDDAGYDWFEAAPKLTGRVFIAVAPDTGVIVQIADSSLPDTDAFSLYPDGVSIYGLEALPPDCSIDGTWRFDSETLTAYRDAELAAGRILSENTRLRTQFATQAMLAISTLQNRVSIGRARAGDADALAAWQNYLIDLDELTDAQLASADFVFPSTPQ